MKQQLEYFIRLNLKNLQEEEIQPILDIFHLTTLQKGEFLKHPNEVSKALAFVTEGSVRYYAIKDNGNEITGRIVDKNNFVTDFISYRTKGKTPIVIETLQPTTMLVAPFEACDKLLEVNLTFNRLMREYMADRIVDMGKLYLLFLTGSARDRYRFIMENNPELLKNIPLRFIASMIGITPTQLSRIRNKRED